MLTQRRSHSETLTGEDCAYDRRIKPLGWLLGEIGTMSAAATLVQDAVLPYVHVSVPRTTGCNVSLTTRNGDHMYAWGDWGLTHPIADPAGAARRIVTALRKESADNEADRARAVIE